MDLNEFQFQAFGRRWQIWWIESSQVFFIVFSRSWKPSIFDVHPDPLGRWIQFHEHILFQMSWNHPLPVVFFDLYPSQKLISQRPSSKAGLLPSGGQFMGVKTLLFQALTTFLASVSAGVAEEVCSALQVPELEVGSWWWWQEVGGISWGSWVVLNFFWGGMMGFKPPGN